MKVGLITLSCAYNYGAVLQAYATERFLNQHGYDAVLIDYVTERYQIDTKDYVYKTTVRWKKNALTRFVWKYTWHKNDVKCRDFFRNFVEEHIPKTKVYYSNEELKGDLPDCDAFISGSDQIWNPYLYDPYYFLEFVQDSRRKIAYAPSFGVMEIPHRCQQRLRKAIAPFRYVSVREKRGAEIVRELTGKQVMVAVDPTLLVSMAHWQTLAKPIDSEQKYLFCYFLSENARYLETAEKIAREKHLTIRMLPMVAADFKKPGTVKEPVGPREWLGLVENADYVLTDSFHCTLFSIRFHKQFNVLQRFKEGDKRGQNSRIHALLQTADMPNRLVVPGEDAITETISDGCFQTADARMAAQAANSRQWLEQALQSCEGAGNSAN